MSPTTAQLQAFADSVRTSAASSFYRTKWGSNERFSELPSTTRADLVVTPLSKRRYKDEKAFIKVVHTTHGLCASEWDFADIALEDYGPIGMRPMVYLAEPDDAVEKSMWCYERNRLPLIGEHIPEVANSAADFYQIDSLVVDAASLPKLLPHLTARTEPLHSITIIGPSFSYQELHEYSRFTRTVVLVLGLPEVGAIAHATLEENPTFTLVPECHIDWERTPLLTKVRMLTMPIIRYEMPELSALSFAK